MKQPLFKSDQELEDHFELHSFVTGDVESAAYYSTSLTFYVGKRISTSLWLGESLRANLIDKQRAEGTVATLDPKTLGRTGFTTKEQDFQ